MGHRGVSLVCLLMLVLTGGPEAAALQRGGASPQGCGEIAQRQSVDSRKTGKPVADDLLLAAAAAGCGALVERFLAQGALADTRDPSGNSALLVAVTANRHKTAEILLKAGADPNEANGLGLTPLSAAVYKGNDRLVSLLLEAGAHSDRQAPDCGGTRVPIVFAARKGRSGIVAKLLNSGLDINARYRHGMTALMLAAGHGGDVSMPEAIETVSLLLERGADMESTNSLGRSALMLAAQRSHAEIVTLLLERGADPLRADLEGNSALELTQDESVLEALGRAMRAAEPLFNQ